MVDLRLRVAWKRGSTLSDYPVGVIVLGVPLENEEIQRVIKYGEKFVRQGNKNWIASLDRIVKEYDPSKDLPIYFCRRTNQLEDGSHRALARKIRGGKTIDVEIGGAYWKAAQYGSNESILAKCKAAIGGMVGKDARWATACLQLKWPEIIGRVGFLHKSVLDVGCQSGLSSFMAYMRGAHPVHGIDIRSDLIEICKVAQKKLNVDPEEVSFRVSGADNGCVEHDITFFMGLPHYFIPGAYESMIEKFAGLSRGTLILELRVSNVAEPKLTTRGTQTLASESWLHQRIARLGFGTENHTIHRKADESRQVWICKRGITP